MKNNEKNNKEQLAEPIQKQCSWGPRGNEKTRR
jgi:hypothetical protein